MSCRSAPGQWPEELGSADAVPEAGGPVRGLVGVGDPPGVLSAVPQQVQSDRTVLVGPGAEVERRVAELLEGGPAMRPADDLEGPASHRETLVRRVSRRRSRCGPGDDAVRGTTATFGDPAEVRHSHQAKGRRVAGKVILAGRLSGIDEFADKIRHPEASRRTGATLEDLLHKAPSLLFIANRIAPQAPDAADTAVPDVHCPDSEEIG